MRLNRLIPVCPFVWFCWLARFRRVRSPRRSVTQADIQRLQDGIADATRDIGQTRAPRRRDSPINCTTRARRRARSDDVFEGQIAAQRGDCARRVLGSSRSHRQHPAIALAARRSGGYTPPATSRRAGRIADDDDQARAARDPVGTEFDVRLQIGLSSDNAQSRGSVRCHDAGRSCRTNADALSSAARLRHARGIVSSVTRATRTAKRTGKLTASPSIG